MPVGINDYLDLNKIDSTKSGVPLHQFSFLSVLISLFKITFLGSIIISCGQKTGDRQGNVNLANFSGPMQIATSFRSDIPLRIDSRLQQLFGTAILTEIDQIKNLWDVEVNGINFFNNDAAANTVTSPNFSSIQDFYFSDSANWGIYIKEDSWFSDVSSLSLAVTQYFGHIRNPGTSSEFLEIIHSDIILNGYDHEFSLNPNGFQYDIETIILHELGHFLGLYHSDNFNSVMYPSLARGMDRVNITTDDIDSLISHYFHYGSSPLNSSSISSGHLGVNATDTKQENFRKPSSEASVFVRGMMELRADGSCNHYMNEQLVHTHKASTGHGHGHKHGHSHSNMK